MFPCSPFHFGVKWKNLGMTKLGKILKGRDFFEKMFGHDFFQENLVVIFSENFWSWIFRENVWPWIFREIFLVVNFSKKVLVVNVSRKCLVMIFLRKYTVFLKIPRFFQPPPDPFFISDPFGNGKFFRFARFLRKDSQKRKISSKNRVVRTFFCLVFFFHLPKKKKRKKTQKKQPKRKHGTKKNLNAIAYPLPYLSTLYPPPLKLKLPKPVWNFFCSVRERSKTRSTRLKLFFWVWGGGGYKVDKYGKHQKRKNNLVESGCLLRDELNPFIWEFVAYWGGGGLLFGWL